MAGLQRAKCYTLRVEIKKRPESPELDQSQMADLRKYISEMSADELERALEQTRADSEKDSGNYVSGGTPANVTRTYIALSDALEAKRKK